MVYYGTDTTENIVVHTNGDVDDMHVITLSRACDEAAFTVNICCDEEWKWKFNLVSSAHYDIVKYMIMDAVFECEDMYELVDMLDEIFETDFADIVINEDE